MTREEIDRLFKTGGSYLGIPVRSRIRGRSDAGFNNWFKVVGGQFYEYDLNIRLNGTFEFEIYEAGRGTYNGFFTLTEASKYFDVDELKLRCIKENNDRRNKQKEPKWGQERKWESFQIPKQKAKK